MAFIDRWTCSSQRVLGHGLNACTYCPSPEPFRRLKQGADFYTNLLRRLLKSSSENNSCRVFNSLIFEISSAPRACCTRATPRRASGRATRCTTASRQTPSCPPEVGRVPSTDPTGALTSARTGSPPALSWSKGKIREGAWFWCVFARGAQMENRGCSGSMIRPWSAGVERDPSCGGSRTALKETTGVKGIVVVVVGQR